MLLDAITRYIERVIHPVFNDIDMGRGMLFNVLDELPRILF
jgi:hypothetical protein